MFHQLETGISRAFAAFLKNQYNAELPVQIEQPKKPEFGEFAVPAAFQLARQLRQPPNAIAAAIAAAMPAISGVRALEVAGGYINIRLDRGTYGQSLLTPRPQPVPPEGKVIVEHTNINPNKAAHIGHLRNAVLGDTFVRMLRASGSAVEVQNYIDNTGVQVADVVVGFHHLEGRSLAEVLALVNDPSVRFDYLCWDLYARTSAHYDEHPESLALRRAVLHEIEEGTSELAALGHVVADAIVTCHLKTMARLGVTYDVLPRESEILHLQFWATAFEQLRDRHAIYLESEGKNSGCWVMPGSAFSSSGGEDDSKVIVRSNGTVTYVGKDIAYQLWKFGLLGKDFHYRQFPHPTFGTPLWVSTVQRGSAGHPGFGGGSSVYNVIDSRQSYLQDVVRAGLRALGYEDQARGSIHFSYEMVALSPRTCAELGITLSEEDQKRTYVEVSGRKGLGVKADDLIDKLIEKALEEVRSRHAADSEEDCRRVANQIAIGALRYFMLKYTRGSVIAFDLGEALAFEGETGPYVQYAAVRARNILRKMAARGESLPDFESALNADIFGRQLADETLWQLLLDASRLDSALDKATASGEPSHMARFAFQLAQSFSNFYHLYPVLSESDAEKRIVLLWMTRYYAAQLERSLAILGVEVPEFM
ncbi:MAG: arginine--tRNA ligase [Acidobacteria bacterium]|nr:arginine--tRNA ligase [Acidobacteriota bacterium]